MKIVNLTPHPVNIYTNDGVLTIASSGIARAEAHTEQIGMVANIPVYRTVYGTTVGLPEQQEYEKTT